MTAIPPPAPGPPSTPATPAVVAAQPPARVPGSGPSLGVRIGLGLALLVPAVVALLWSYVIPSISTVEMSFQRARPNLPPAAAGGLNYDRLSALGFFDSIGFALLLSLVPLLLALVAAPLLAVVADRAGRVARLVTRGLLALPLACYAPTALAVAWWTYRVDLDTWMENQRLTSVGAAAGMTFGLVVAVAATLFLSVVRRRATAGGRIGLALVAVGGTLGLGVVATGLQSFTLQNTIPSVRNEAATPVFVALVNSMRRFDFGLGAAALTILLGILAVLGLLAVGLLIATRTRIEFEGRRDRTSEGAAKVPSASAPSVVAGRQQSNPVMIVLLVLGLVGFLSILGYALFPWLRSFFGPSTPMSDQLSTGSLVVNTWIPPLISAVVAVGIAVLGGFAIGGLRPLGRFSELLLLPFAPWFFVGTGPLALAGFERAREADQFNTFVGLILPSWLSIPALVAFTLLFRGQHERWRAGQGFAASMLLPALPMLGLAGLLTWLLGAQDLLWPYLVTAGEVTTAPLATIIAMRQGLLPGGNISEVVGLVLPIPVVLLLLVAFGVFQVCYLDRLAIRAGRRE
ncbi:sugar ABC transporter permease [Micromonospora sp. NPDC003197]